jgi:hypothetical protein
MAASVAIAGARTSLHHSAVFISARVEGARVSVTSSEEWDDFLACESVIPGSSDLKRDRSVPRSSPDRGNPLLWNPSEGQLFADLDDWKETVYKKHNLVAIGHAFNVSKFTAAYIKLLAPVTCLDYFGSKLPMVEEKRTVVSLKADRWLLWFPVTRDLYAMLNHDGLPRQKRPIGNELDPVNKNTRARAGGLIPATRGRFRSA